MAYVVNAETGSTAFTSLPVTYDTDLPTSAAPATVPTSAQAKMPVTEIPVPGGADDN